ncbi:sodium:calcium antiporter [Patescibacteria group bacterium]|nr:sodium:calcium antiporter [Patescibacteria group bacterium]
MTTHIIIFVISFFILIFASKWLVKSLTRVARLLGWKEFVVAFFTMALASSIPNLSVGIISALRNIPSLAFGEIIGNNIIDLTLAVALAAIISKNGLRLPSQMVQTSGLFTIFVAVLPPIMAFDGVIGRGDGIMLILIFLIYVFWLFNKKDRFSKIYNHADKKFRLKRFFKNIFILLAAVGLLILAAEGIVRSAMYFSEFLNVPLVLIGVLVVGMGNALPEIFFGIQAARKGEDWVVIGDLMGSVIITATLVLGLVALIRPIIVENIAPFAVARLFLVISAAFFILFLRTGRKITKKEAIWLFLIFVAFVAAEIMFL